MEELMFYNFKVPRMINRRYISLKGVSVIKNVSIFNQDSMQIAALQLR